MAWRRPPDSHIWLEISGGSRSRAVNSGQRISQRLESRLEGRLEVSRLGHLHRLGHLGVEEGFDVLEGLALVIDVGLNLLQGISEGS